MRAPADILVELTSIRDLLLVPGPLTMALCEQRLTQVANQSALPSEISKVSEAVQPILRNIRFLLEKARDFWAARGLADVAARHYAPGGSVVPESLPSTFEIEF